MAHFRHTASELDSPIRYEAQPHIAEIEGQIRWEMHGIERGVERVREQMTEAKHLGDTDVGMKLIAEVAPKLVAEIRKAQAEAVAGVSASKRGAPVQWWWIIMTLPAEQLAVITLKALFNQSPREFTFNLAVTSVAHAISRSTQTQIDYETWKEAEKAKAKADPDHEDQHMRFLRSTKQIDARAFAKFSARIERQRAEKWDKEMGIAFGVKLITLLCDAVPDWFSVDSSRLKGGRQEKQITFSQLAKETMADLVERNELSRPMLLPMVCPPARWQRAS